MDTGSFGAAGGGISPELQEAIARRQGSQTQAVTQGSANFKPAIQPATPPPPRAMQMPQGGNMPFNPVSGQPEATQAPTMGIPQTPESQIIIKALDGRLKSISKQEEMQLGGQNAPNPVV